MNNEDKILKTLKDFGRLPTYRIAGIVGLNPVNALSILQRMWESGEIIGEVETNSTYWKLKAKVEASKPKEAESPNSNILDDELKGGQKP